MSSTLLPLPSAGAPTVRPAPRSGLALAMRLPVPSVLAREVANATTGARTVPTEVTDLVVCNPPAAARVIARAATHAGRRVDGVRAGLALLSAGQVAEAASVAPTHSLFEGAPGLGGATRLALAARAVEVARVAGELVPHVSGGTPDDLDAAWTAGLLRDLGRTAGAVDGGRGGTDAAGPHMTPGMDAGRRADNGARFCERIGLTPRIADAIRHRMDPIPPGEPVGEALWLAVRVVRARAGECGSDVLVASAEACGIQATLLARVLIGAAAAEVSAAEALTPREHDVLLLLADGLVPKQIAAEFGCTVSTVNNHLHHVYRKLGVAGQAHALLVARGRGWV